MDWPAHYAGQTRTRLAPSHSSLLYIFPRHDYTSSQRLSHPSLMAVFLTGGTGKTATPIAHLLQDANIPFLVGSRRGEAAAPAGMVGTKFDWLDSSTFPNPFQYNFPGGQRISAIYLVLANADPGAVQTFIDYAFKTHQVKRFVFLAGATIKLGDPYYGQIWQHFLDLGVDYCILRPTWFIGIYY